MASSDLLLHPVRLRVVQALLGDRELTTAQLVQELGDVPPASLYRHIAVLTSAGILYVVKERRIRGGLERTYALRIDRARVGPDDLAGLTVDEHANMFRTFVAGLVAEYDRYLASGTPDLVRDGVGYSVAGLWLSDEEFAAFAHDMSAVFEKYRQRTEREDRRRRMIATIVVPTGPRTSTTGGDPA